MMYRYWIETDSGRFDGWAHNPIEMLDKFRMQYPGEQNPTVYSGIAPEVEDDRYEDDKEAES